jgi:hypothetical protein
VGGLAGRVLLVGYWVQVVPIIGNYDKILRGRFWVLDSEY